MKNNNELTKTYTKAEVEALYKKMTEAKNEWYRTGRDDWKTAYEFAQNDYEFASNSRFYCKA